MVNPVVYTPGQAIIEKKARAFFTGSTALRKGMAVCYDSNRGTLTAQDETRQSYVEMPSNLNNNYFAGIVRQDYTAVTGGQNIGIWLPGGHAEILVGANTIAPPTAVPNTQATTESMLTFGVGGGIAGWFKWGGFRGRGSAVPLVTNASVELESDLTGAAAKVNSTTLTDTNATFDTNGVAAGDQVVIISGNTGVTPAVYTVSSVTSDTVLVLTAAPSASDLFCTYFIVSDYPTVQAYLLDGEESGGVEVYSPPLVGNVTGDCMIGGRTLIGGGLTIGTGDVTFTLPDARGIGDKKAFECLGTLTTNDFMVSVETTGAVISISGVGTFDTIEFDAEGDKATLQHNGDWWTIISKPAATAVA